MTEEQAIQLSALVDGQLTGAPVIPLVSSIASDPLLRGTWERYHLIGQVLRGERVEPAVCGLAERVQDRLRAESVPGGQRPMVVPSRFRAWRWHPPFAGAALAAAAVLLAVFAVPGLYQAPNPAQEPSAMTRAPLAAVPHRWQTDRQDLAGKLDLFLITHQEAAPEGAVKGLLPYAVLVGYEAGR